MSGYPENLARNKSDKSRKGFSGKKISSREFERKLKKKERKKERKKEKVEFTTAAGANSGRRGEKSGGESQSLRATVEVESRKIYGQPRKRCKRKASATFDVTMVDVHLYGSHCNLHCAFALENARDIALHARDGVRARTRVEFGTYASSEREERLFHKIVVPLIH